MRVAMRLKSRASTGSAVTLGEVLHHMLVLTLLLLIRWRKDHIRSREEAECKDLCSTRMMRRVLANQTWRRRQMPSCVRCFPKSFEECPLFTFVS